MLLNKPPVHHTFGRVDFNRSSYISSDFTSHLHIVPMNDCVRYRFCYGTFGIIRQFFSMITLFPPFLPGIVPHKRYGILQLADYEPSGTTSSIASPKPLGISKPFHRVQNMRDCCTGDSLANNAPVFVKLPFWSLGHLG